MGIDDSSGALCGGGRASHTKGGLTGTHTSLYQRITVTDEMHPSPFPLPPEDSDLHKNPDSRTVWIE